eukprot:13880368-Ditylum_brightwellii.AAC.1
MSSTIPLHPLKLVCGGRDFFFVGPCQGDERFLMAAMFSLSFCNTCNISDTSFLFDVFDVFGVDGTFGFGTFGVSGTYGTFWLPGTKATGSEADFIGLFMVPGFVTSGSGAFLISESTPLPPSS